MPLADSETRAEEVFLMRSQLSKLQLLTAALKQENARLSEENKVLKRAFVASTSGAQPPYSTTTIHASHGAETHPSSCQQAPVASTEMMDYIEGEILMLQEQLHKTRLKLQQAEAAQGAWGSMSPAGTSSRPLLHHQHHPHRKAAASPVNRRLLQYGSPSRAVGHSLSPGRAQHKDLKQRANSRGRQAGQRRAINSKTINLLHSGLPTMLSSRSQL